MAKITMNEKRLASTEKELEKLYKRIVRNQKALDKKTKACEKLGCLWTEKEWFEHRNSNNYNMEQFTAIVELNVAKGDVEEAERKIALYEKQFTELSEAVEKDSLKNTELAQQIERASNIENEWLKEKAEKEYQEWLERFKAECLKDGVIVKGADSTNTWGFTSKGKHFVIYANCGCSERSRHCYTLRIDDNTVFTSGEFWRAYSVVKSR